MHSPPARTVSDHVHYNKSDISYLKTSQPLDVPIYSRALLESFSVGYRLCRHHEQLLVSGISALGQPRVIASTLPLLLSIHLELLTVLDYL